MSTHPSHHGLIFNLIHKYRHSTIPKGVILLFDLLFLTMGFAIGEFFVLHDNDIVLDWTAIVIRYGFCLVVTLCSFLVLGTFRGILRHSGMNDIYKILFACGICIVFCFAVIYFNNNHQIVQYCYLPTYTVVTMTYMITALLMVLFRIVCQRIYNDYIRKQRPVLNVVIYGAGAAGVITYSALKADMRLEYHIIAYIDDSASKQGQSIMGVPIMRRKDVLNEKFVGAKDIRQLIIAIPSLKIAHKQLITNRALELGLTVRSVPHIRSWIGGRFNSAQIEDIKIEDLLQRESIKLDNENIVRDITGKIILITGAAGSIGSEICRQVLHYQPKKVIMLDQAESPLYDIQYELRNIEPYCKHTDKMEFVIASVKDSRRMQQLFETHHPDIVYHAAAYKHVPFMEENAYEAIKVNVFGTKTIADLSLKYGVKKFVMISTDKAVNPTNVMGATKRLAEIYVQNHSTEDTHFITTRFGNVLGSSGSVIPLFKKQLLAGGPLTVTHKDITRYFMTIPEACNLVLEAGAMGTGGDIFVFDMGRAVKIYDLAAKMIQLSGLQGIEIKEIGLRPGEKLYEELLASKENTIPTHHPKILRAQVANYPVDKIEKELSELFDLLPSMDPMQLVAKMKQIVPEFISNNSVFCQLDTNLDNSDNVGK